MTQTQAQTTWPIGDARNFQGIIAAFRETVEDEWKTPPIRNTAIYLFEECGEFLSRVNRDNRPFDLRSAPAEEKDDARREAGTALAMLATLANQFNYFLRPGYLGNRYDPVEQGGEGRDTLSLAIAIGDLSGDIASRVDTCYREGNYTLTPALRDDMDVLLALLIKAGDVMKFNTFEWMTKFLVSVEYKVAEKRKKKQQAQSRAARAAKAEQVQRQENDG
jgi:NTP pyrophosphatase (non-canonical NTP hydrolase)